MALLLPAGGGQATAGLAVAGRWEGTMTEAETDRKIEGQLSAGGGRLTGSPMTRTGRPSLRTPPPGGAYAKGPLKVPSPARAAASSAPRPAARSSRRGRQGTPPAASPSATSRERARAGPPRTPPALARRAVRARPAPGPPAPPARVARGAHRQPHRRDLRPRP